MFRKLEKVLLVDDDRITNFLNERLLKKFNLTEQIEICLNGQEALDSLETSIKNNDNFPDLILLDINMPVMDGIDFLKKFKEKFESKLNVLIVVLTTSTHMKDMESILRLGNADFISKPLNEEKLSSIINKYLWIPSANRMA